MTSLAQYVGTLRVSADVVLTAHSVVAVGAAYLVACVLAECYHAMLVKVVLFAVETVGAKVKPTLVTVEKRLVVVFCELL